MGVMGVISAWPWADHISWTVHEAWIQGCGDMGHPTFGMWVSGRHLAPHTTVCVGNALIYCVFGLVSGWLGGCTAICRAVDVCLCVLPQRQAVRSAHTCLLVGLMHRLHVPSANY
jgi:hypothetical protein